MKKNAVPLVVFSMLALVWVHAETPKKVVRIALVKSSGSLATDVLPAVRMAVQEAGAAPRFQGLRIVLSEFDDESSPAKATEVAARIAGDPAVVGVIGHLNSLLSMAAAPIYARAGLAMLSPCATVPELTEQQLSPGWGETRNVFRLVASEDALGRFSAEFVFNELKANTAAILDEAADRKAVVNAFRRRYEALGGRIVLDHQPPSDKEPGPVENAVFGRLIEAKPGVVFFAMEDEAAVEFLAAAHGKNISARFVGVQNTEAGFQPKFLITGSAEAAEFMTAEEFWSKASPADIFVVARSGVSPEVSLERFGDPKPGLFGLYAYELTHMLLEALEKAGPDRKGIVAALRTITHTGLLGETRFDEKGDRLPESIAAYRVEKGRFVPYRAK